MASRFATLILLTLPILALPSSQLASRALCATPSVVPGYSNNRLPDPFLFEDGTPVLTLEDWACRRSQIAAIVQGYEAGYLPPRPPFVSSTFSVVNGTGNFTVQVVLDPNHTISFAQPIMYPSGAAPGAGWPLIIAYDALSIPVPDGIAVMVYTNDNIAQQNGPSSRGIGLFYDLYGANATASAMTAWVWGVSRIIDALEITPEANINTAKIAVTGCSRDGKGSLMAGAFEPRIALTIPQESGSGGDTFWRLSK